jgi:uncharacterized protein DUF4019/PDZ domain-containing protein
MLFRKHWLTLLCVLTATAGLADQPAAPKPAFLGFAFNYKQGLPEMRLGVCTVLDGTPAAAAGLQQDDLITAVDGKTSFKNAAEVLAYISQRKPGDELVLDILRKDQRLRVKMIACEATDQQQARVKSELELANQEGASLIAAREAIAKWTHLLDSGLYEKCWNELAQFPKEKMPHDRWMTYMKGARQPMGELRARKEAKAEYVRSLRPDQDGAFIQFESSFSNRTSVVEKFLLIREKDGRWRAGSYLTQ